MRGLGGPDFLGRGISGRILGLILRLRRGWERAVPDRIVVDFKKGEVRREPEPSRDLFHSLLNAIRRRRRRFVLTGGSVPAPGPTKTTQ